jgi:hypothetical protein
MNPVAALQLADWRRQTATLYAWVDVQPAYDRSHRDPLVLHG